MLDFVLGMTFLGWPLAVVCLGLMAGRNLPEGWYLPVLVAWLSRFQSAWLLGNRASWVYAGVLLLIGLAAMLAGYEKGVSYEE